MIAIADKFATKKFPISVMFLIETSPSRILTGAGLIGMGNPDSMRYFVLVGSKRYRGFQVG